MDNFPEESYREGMLSALPLEKKTGTGKIARRAAHMAGLELSQCRAPFAGAGGAAPLPACAGIETINDLDAFVSNVWRPPGRSRGVCLWCTSPMSSTCRPYLAGGSTRDVHGSDAGGPGHTCARRDDGSTASVADSGGWCGGWPCRHQWQLVIRGARGECQGVVRRSCIRDAGRGHRQLLHPGAAGSGSQGYKACGGTACWIGLPRSKSACVTARLGDWTRWDRGHLKRGLTGISDRLTARRRAVHGPTGSTAALARDARLCLQRPPSLITDCTCGYSQYDVLLQHDAGILGNKWGYGNQERTRKKERHAGSSWFASLYQAQDDFSWQLVNNPA
jgi:hypothetical protein